MASRRALEFACQSKSCAPPPVGSGGSKPGGVDVRSRSFDKKIRSGNPKVKAAADRALMNSVLSGHTKLFHGTNASGIKVGDTINATESPGSQHLGGPHAFATRHLPTAADFGRYARINPRGDLNIYEVVPISTKASDLKSLPSSDGGVHIADPKGYRVVAVHPASPTSLRNMKGFESRQRQNKISVARRERRVSRIKTTPELDSALEELIKALGR